MTGCPGSGARVLAITGTEDVIIPAKNAGLLTERIPGARLVRVPGAGHGLQYQCPRVLGSAIISFLAEDR